MSVSAENETSFAHRNAEVIFEGGTNTMAPNRLSGGSDRGESDDALSMNEEDDESIVTVEELAPRLSMRQKRRKTERNIKIIVLFLCWAFATAMLMVTHEQEIIEHNVLSIVGGQTKTWEIETKVTSGLTVHLRGPFEIPNVQTKNLLTLKVQQLVDDKAVDVSKEWTLKLAKPEEFDTFILADRRRLFTLEKVPTDEQEKFQIVFQPSIAATIPFVMSEDPSPVPQPAGIIIGAVLLFFMYALLLCDIMHRTLVMLVVCTLALGLMSMLHERPDTYLIIRWIDFEIMLLLFGFSIIMALYVEAGLLDYLAVRAYEWSNGHIWPVLNCMCLMTVIGATGLDSSIIVMIITPITLRICEVMELNPIPVLSCLIVAANLGAGLTPNGEAPNNYFRTIHYIKQSGITYLDYLPYLGPGVLIICLQSYLHMRMVFHNSQSMRFRGAAEVERLRRVIKFWSHTAKSLSVYSKDEKAMRDTLITKVKRLRGRMRRIGRMPSQSKDYEETLAAMKEMFPIQNMPLLVKTSISFGIAIVLCLLYEAQLMHYLHAHWIALLCGLMLLIMADMEEMEKIIDRVEWSLLLFFAGFTVFSEATRELGINDYISETLSNFILEQDSEQRLLVALLTVFCGSVMGTVVLDNANCAATILNVVLTVVQHEDSELPLLPLVWTMVLGCNIGTCGTLVSSMSNVIVAGLAERHGYNFPFLDYLRVGFPVTLAMLIVASVYIYILYIVGFV